MRPLGAGRLDTRRTRLRNWLTSTARALARRGSFFVCTKVNTLIMLLGRGRAVLLQTLYVICQHCIHRSW